MEEFSRLGEGGAPAAGGTAKRSFRYLPLPSTSASASSASPPPWAVYHAANSQPNYLFQTPAPLPLPSPPPPPPPQKREADDAPQGDMEEIKAKIMSHPRYSALLRAFMDCQKVGAPPEVVARLSAIAQELASTPSHRRHVHASPDPELDQFMESYCDMLLRYREELARPLQEAKDFLGKMESQFNAITGSGAAAVGSSEEEEEQEQEEGSGGERDHVDPAQTTEEKELKHRLLKKYGGYLSSLRQELSKKKKKKVKLPKDARQKLLSWWEMHYKWPYPSETEKVALAESTGLDQKQINNWFINQRKRHWKPSDDMQFVVMDGYHHHPHAAPSASAAAAAAAAALYMEAGGQFMTDGMYRLG